MNLTDRWTMFEGVDTQFRVLITGTNKWGKKPDQQTHLCGLTHFCCPKYQMMAGPGCWPRDWWIHGLSWQKKWETCLSFYFQEDYENKQYFLVPRLSGLLSGWPLFAHDFLAPGWLWKVHRCLRWLKLIFQGDFRVLFPVSMAMEDPQ